VDKQEAFDLVTSGIEQCSHAELPDLDGAEVLQAEFTRGDYAESEGWALVHLNDGRYAFLAQSEDTTGHGCRCSGSIAYYETEAEAKEMHKIEIRG
jgi:hypothetical protein